MVLSGGFVIVEMLGQHSPFKFTKSKENLMKSYTEELKKRSSYKHKRGEKF